MDRKIGVRRMNKMSVMGVKRRMPKNMMGRKKGNMISRQEYQMPSNVEREDMAKEPMRRSSKNSMEKNSY